MSVAFTKAQIQFLFLLFSPIKSWSKYCLIWQNQIWQRKKQLCCIIYFHTINVFITRLISKWAELSVTAPSKEFKKWGGGNVCITSKMQCKCKNANYFVLAFVFCKVVSHIFCILTRMIMGSFDMVRHPYRSALKPFPTANKFSHPDNHIVAFTGEINHV